MSIYVNSTSSSKSQSSLSKSKHIGAPSGYYSSYTNDVGAVIVTNSSGTPTLHYYNAKEPWTSSYTKLHADTGQLSVDAPLDTTYNDDEYSPRSLSSHCGAFLPAFSMSIDYTSGGEYNNYHTPLLSLFTPTQWWVNKAAAGVSGGFTCSNTAGGWWNGIASGLWLMSDSWGGGSELFIAFFANCDHTEDSKFELEDRGGTVIVYVIPNTLGMVQYCNLAFSFRYGSDSTKKTLHMSYWIRNRDGTIAEGDNIEVHHNAPSNYTDHYGKNYIYEDEFNMTGKNYFQYWNSGKSYCKARLYVPKANRNKTNV